MRDLWTALALVLVIGGALYALFPQGMKRVAARALLVPPQALRLAGLAAACIGVILVWVVRRCVSEAADVGAAVIADAALLP